MRIRVKKLERARDGHIYQLVLGPVQGWFPSRSANFCLDVPLDEIDPEWYQNCIPERFNASVWLQKRKKLYTLRVPKNYEKEIRKYLLWAKFRFNSRKWVWVRRRKFRME